MTLVEFLNAMLDEDESLACVLASTYDGHVGSLRSSRADLYALAPHLTRHDPTRVLREVETKRAIIVLHGRRTQWVDQDRDTPVCAECGTAGGNDPVLWPCTTLLLLALPYVDNPDCLDEWSPQYTDSSTS
jgi:hypothetical protein